MRRVECAVALALSAALAAPASAHAPGARSDRRVASGSAMLMDGTQLFGRVLLDQLEWRRDGSADAAAWDIEGWYGGDRDKLWARTEGMQAGSATQDARAELLWDRALGSWWNVQAGVREDFGNGPPRTWAALGVVGLAPYWFDVEVTLYAGDEGRTAARVKVEQDILLTQRLILQPEAELNFYGKRDPARRLGSGLSQAEVGLRLRYEIRRELAPYIGVVWSREVRAAGNRPAAGPLPTPASAAVSEAQFVAGVRAWF